MHSNMETWVSVCGTVYVAVISFLLCHLVQNMYMYQYMYICQPKFGILLHPLCIVTWKHGCHCLALCFAVIPLLFPDLSQNVYIHQYMYFCLPDSQCLVHPISILTWKDGFFCVTLCACSSHSTCGPTTWLQYVHASVH